MSKKRMMDRPPSSRSSRSRPDDLVIFDLSPSAETKHHERESMSKRKEVKEHRDRLKLERHRAEVAATKSPPLIDGEVMPRPVTTGIDRSTVPLGIPIAKSFKEDFDKMFTAEPVSGTYEGVGSKYKTATIPCPRCDAYANAKIAKATIIVARDQPDKVGGFFVIATCDDCGTQIKTTVQVMKEPIELRKNWSVSRATPIEPKAQPDVVLDMGRFKKKRKKPTP